MAKPTTTNSTPNAPEKPSTEWEFTMDFDTSVPPPEKALKPQRATELPFASKFFTPAMTAALEGKKPHKFIPKAFFLGRAAKPEKVNGSYMKSKVRDQFNKWKKDQAKAVQDSLGLLMFERDGTAQDFPEAGLSVWIVTSQPAKKDG